jgi:hypothetical protein
MKRKIMGYGNLVVLLRLRRHRLWIGRLEMVAGISSRDNIII